jgi:hypothetical protein
MTASQYCHATASLRRIGLLCGIRAIIAGIFGMAPEIESGTGVPVLDSVAVTLWHCLKLAGSPLLAPRWGKLLA